MCIKFWLNCRNYGTVAYYSSCILQIYCPIVRCSIFSSLGKRKRGQKPGGGNLETLIFQEDMSYDFFRYYYNRWSKVDLKPRLGCRFFFRAFKFQHSRLAVCHRILDTIWWMFLGCASPGKAASWSLVLFAQKLKLCHCNFFQSQVFWFY